MSTIQTKTCCKCKEEKETSLFAKNKNNRDGLEFKCKACRSLYHLERKERNKEKNKDFVPDPNKTKRCNVCKKVKTHPEFIIKRIMDSGLGSCCLECDAIRWKKYISDNKEHITQYKKNYFANNFDEIQVKYKARYEDNKETIIAKTKAYVQAHKEETKIRQRDYHVNHLEEARMHRHTRKARVKGAKIEQVSATKVYERDSYICGICGEPIDKNLKHPDPMSCSLDHIIPLSKGGEHSMANTQPAHLVCNLSKGNRIINKETKVSA